MSRRTIHDLVAEAKSRIEELTPRQLAAEIASGQSLVVDIRDVRELWRDGTIPSSRHAPRGMLEFWADPTSEYHREAFDPNRRVVLFCAGGQRSALAATALQDIGYKDVAHLAGGFRAWRQAGQPLVTVEPSPGGNRPRSSNS
jgi:rhodanese-related sulfurtransferase